MIQMTFGNGYVITYYCLYKICLIQDCIMLVYDVTNQKSFDTIASSMWLWLVNIFIQSFFTYLYQYTSAERVLVGNKVDLESQRAISKDKAGKLGQKRNMFLIETSAVTGHNINEAFGILTKVSNDHQMSVRNKVYCQKLYFYDTVLLDAINFDLFTRTSKGMIIIQ